MTKEEIFNTYAIEQGYESWYDLLKCTVTIHELSQDLNKVTDLIQEELKKKICETLTLVHDMPYIEIKETISETKIL